MKDIKKIQYNRGAAMMIFTFFFMFISLTVLIGIVFPVVREFKIASDSLTSKQTYFFAESGVEDILSRLRTNKQIGASETLVLGTLSTTTTITDISTSQKEIVSLGDINSVQRKVNVKVGTGEGASFSYGVQVGVGGFLMDNNSKIEGSVYSNGNITGSGTVTGSATAANSPALTADQSNGSGTPDYDITFGKLIGAQDFAQSFQISTTEVINKVQLYIKKVETPSNITLRIVTNSGGSPSTTTLASATISSSSISTNYGWIDVPLNSHPQLSANTTYWIVLDADNDSSEYYKIGANSNGYANGTGKIGRYTVSWGDTSPAGLDSFFSVYLGGLTGSIDGITIGSIVNGEPTGNAYAHTVTNATIIGTNYCQTGSGNNKNCDTSRADPVQVAMPISEQNILDWKTVAQNGDVFSGNKTVSSNTTLGPLKITGNLTINNKATLTVDGTIWVQGNLVVDNLSVVKLASWYGDSEGVIVVDGTISIQNNSTFEDSGTDGSYVLALSTSSSSSAITLANNAGAVALYAANGTIDVAQRGTAKSLTGHYIHLNENAIITYDSGLANANFVNGPGGTWNISSWKEAE